MKDKFIEQLEKQFQEKLFNLLSEKYNSNINTCSAPIYNPLDTISEEQLKRSADILMSNQLNYLATAWVEKNNCILVDWEEMRKEYPYIEQRGRTLFYNYEDECIIKSINKETR